MSYSATLSSGREIAKQRRQAIANGGSKALARSTGSKASPGARRENGRSRPRTRRVSSAPEATANNAWASSTTSWNSPRSKADAAALETATFQTAVDTMCDLAEQNPPPVGSNAESAVRQLCRNRRQALATQGKAALPSNGKAAALRPTGRRRSNNGAGGTVSKEGNRQAPPNGSEAAAFEAAVDAVCELAEQTPSQLGSNTESAVRQLCRNRRRALATQGKAALPGKVGVAARIEARRNGSTKAMTSGRELAKLRRIELCHNGRGDAPSCRPTGRIHPKRGEAPPKVQQGTTLSGKPFTGTQVERTQKVTGNEPGTCRVITGTEYIGTEQYSQFCGALPKGRVPKVGESLTSHSQTVTGTEVGRSPKVTGDEGGSCRPITGSEYLGVEQFQEFCAARGLLQRPEKVIAGSTPKRIPITGFDEARANRVTGAEIGSSRPITGTVYMDAASQERSLPAAAPAKVEITHTNREMPVSGTVVGRSEKVTGDEAGFCKPVTGTEYITNEQFQSFCRAKAAPPPAKVGLDQSRSGLRITGNLVDRSEKVTGNEPGSCQRVTGSQYGQPERYGLCDGAPEKVRAMHTLRGGSLTGTEVGHSPKLTGDDHGGCQTVTGTEYVGRDQYEAYCEGAPVPGGEKVGVSHTWHNQPVTGNQVGRSGKVTGDEQGACQPVSGSSFIGQEQYAEFCEPAAAATKAARTRVQRATPGMPMTGIQPGPDEQVTGVIERGVCQPVSGTPYLGADQYASYCPSQEGMPPSGEVVPAEQPKLAPPPGQGFSIMSPAREAQLRRRKQRITGTAYGTGAASRITGPVNLAMGLVSGTPEFRYQEEEAPIPAMAAAPEEVAPLPRERITGEGREAGPKITGDDWGRSNQMTGTEGQWAQRRNPTLRRDMRGSVMGAYANKERERPEISSPRITGSSGNDKGTLVTLSGGARG